MENLSDIGERKAIDIISDIVSKGSEAVGIGDDCAAFDNGNDFLLVSTDMIADETHIPEKMSPWQIGWYSISVNLSDIAAKGGFPLGLVLSLGLPKNTSVNFLKELVKGADDCAKTYKTSIVGGDTKEHRHLTICGTVFGKVKKNEFMSRYGMKSGEILAVTGHLGKAGAGYLAIKLKNKNKNYFKDLLEPKPRVKEGRLMAEEQIITSCMDISDGLSSSLYQLAKINGLGFCIHKEKIPISSLLKKIANENKNIDIFDYSINFGGDFELLFTLPKNKFKQLQLSLKRINCPITAIGEVTKETEIILKDGNNFSKILNSGYEHFKS
ncbi:MAG: thiamine-phosphate kinase, partial [Candidatus Thermoplasmatota archaeon]|nr:thiamine-phosphate kinase [Candidatus Thermoplasmatota archaeon]